MSTNPVNPVSQPHSASAQRRSAIIVASCTILGAAAQILIKVGMSPAHLDPAVHGLIPLVLALVAVAYGMALIVPEIAQSLVVHPSRGAQFRILSANVWHDNPTPDLAVTDIIARGADAVLLQEPDGTLEPQLTRLKSRYPYASDCAGSGVQIFVKSPIVAQGCGLGSGTRADLVWIQTTAPDGRPVTLVTTHFDWPFPPSPQAAERANLAQRVRLLPNDDLILAGDFNTTPWSFAMRRQDKSLVPLRRRTLAWFSWPARLDALAQPWPMPVLPIDDIYAGPAWRSARLTRLRIRGSDHFATEAILTRQL